MAENTLTITDNRTGKQYEIAIENETIKALDLRKIKVAEDDFGLMTYDPAFMNTASTRSRIAFIDGDKGILEYRGDPIDELAEKSSYPEVAYLLFFFSSRRRHTRLQGDWSSDVCSSDLRQAEGFSELISLLTQ